LKATACTATASAAHDQAQGGGAGALPAASRSGDPVRAWEQLAGDLDGLLCEPLRSPDFLADLDAIAQRLRHQLRVDPDSLLFVAMYSAATSTDRYAAMHALRVCAVCELAAALLGEGAEARGSLARRVALTMNVAMFAEQNRMATQSSPLTPAQRELVRSHAALGAEMLRGLGVDDPDWLHAVAMHHDPDASPAGASSLAIDVARLVRSADTLMAGLSRRRQREALPSAASSGRVFSLEGRKPDTAGAALIKALGIYPPGTLVKLANHETAIVRSRGQQANQPRVLAVLRPDGMPHLSVKARDTSLAVYRVTGSLMHARINLRLPLHRLLDHKI
jgi:hypothetical protein